MRTRSLPFLVLVGLVGAFAYAPQAVATESNIPTIGGTRERIVLERERTFYVVAAHPDDETTSWSYLEQLPEDTYTVFTMLTKGEGTESCLTPEESYNRPGSDALPIGELETFVRRVTSDERAPTDEDSTGPYKYEGPGSPVDEPDKGERHPFGYPWVGTGTEAFKDARVASFHWFLDEQFRNDGIGTDLSIENDPELDDDYKGTFCPRGHQGRGEGQPVEKQIGCAQVWADELGARIFFDFGNPAYSFPFPPPAFTPEMVTAALQTVRASRAAWGMPVLPEEGVLSPAMYPDGESCPENPWLGPDHGVVNEAIRYHDQGLPLRAGIMACETDAIADGAPVRTLHQAPSSMVLWNLLNPVNGYRLGAAVVNYGWLFPDYGFPGCLECSFWEVRDEVTRS